MKVDKQIINNVWKKEIDELIEEFFVSGGASTPSETINNLLMSYFTHQDRQEYHEDPKHKADVVFTATSVVTFLVKLSEYWEQYKTHSISNNKE